jgi:hypothetical protein
MPLFEGFRDSVQDLPYSKAVQKFRQWYAEQILAAFTAAGIPFDRELVRQALLWETVTDNERGGDLGNLPRLLAALGLGGEWQDYVKNAEAPPPEETCPVVPEEPPQPEYLPLVLGCTSSLPLTPLQGGTVDLPLKRLETIAFMADAAWIVYHAWRKKA